MKRQIKLLFFLLVAGCFSCAHGEEEKSRGWTLLMVGLHSDFQLPSLKAADQINVYGLRLSLLGSKCHNFAGLDMGFGANAIDGQGYGAQLGLGNGAKSFTGIQLGLIGNGSHNLSGVQLGLLINQSTTMKGLQLGFINHSDQTTGIQAGFYNWGRSDGFLLQIGFINNARPGDLTIQLGIFNTIVRGGGIMGGSKYNSSRPLLNIDF